MSGWAAVEWSPTGDYISFVTYSADYVYDLYTAHADGSNVTLVASDMNRFADWSPDGAWLAYEKKSADNLDVYISRPDGSETRPLAATPADERTDGWVEGGARLLVSRSVADEGNGTGGLDLVSVAGATTPFAANASVYGISPDGTECSLFGGAYGGRLSAQAAGHRQPYPADYFAGV